MKILSSHLKTCIAILLSLMPISKILAEELPEFKFGKISKHDILNSKFENDTNAHAFYLFDTGRSEIKYFQQDGFRIEFTRHCAIKFVTKSGYEHASFEIPIYEETKGVREEKVTKVKAITYNVEDGKLLETSLNKKDIFIDKENENWSNYKFTMPNVKVGSVIEVQYKVVSDFLWNLPSWYFQNEIPCKWSILNVKIPEYFSYAKDMKGYVPLTVSESNLLNGQINISSVERRNQGYQAILSNQINNNTISFKIFQNLLAAKDVPAFEPEPYTDADINYISSISFELESTKFPNQNIKLYTTTWEKIGESLMEDESFGRQLKGVNSAKDITEGLIDSDISEVEIAKAIFDYVKANTKWDRRTTKWCNNVRQIIKTGVGSSGDINIMLINMLDAAGLEVFPVLLRTRSSGKLPFSRPSLSSLNYVVAGVRIENETILLDATENEIPFNFIPERCLNGKGLVLKDKNKIEWIDLASKRFSRKIVYGELALSESGEIEAVFNKKYDGYFGLRRRKSVDIEKDEIVKKFQHDNPGFSVDSYEMSNADNLLKSFNEKISGTISDRTTLVGDMIYFNPCLYENYEENPFKIDDRMYPVDFGYPMEDRIIYSFYIPEGWQVESLPERIILSLPDEKCKFQYVVQETGGRIMISQTFIIKETMFLPDSYASLKDFFKMIIDKQQEQIVLKRI